MELWATGASDVVHADYRCPAGGDGWWSLLPLNATGTVCSVCGPLLPFAKCPRPTPGAQLAQLALHTVAADHALTVPLEPRLLAQAGIHVASAASLAAASYHLDHSVSTLALAAVVTARLRELTNEVERLRREHALALTSELCQRHLVAGDGPQDVPSPPVEDWAHQAWRATRWAVRRGLRPLPAALATVTQERRDDVIEMVRDWAVDLADTASAVCSGDRHLIAVTSTSPSASSRTRTLEALGAIIPETTGVGAVCLPAPLIPTLISPGVYAADAGPVGVPVADEPDITRAFLGLWDPSGTGPLAEPAAALAAARVVLGSPVWSGG